MPRGSLALVVVILCLPSGCTGAVESPLEGSSANRPPGTETPPYTSPIFTGCVTNERFFARELWAGTLEPSCLGCHSPQGVAAASALVLEPVEGNPTAMNDNYQTLLQLAGQESDDGRPFLLRKPLGDLAHGGGAVIVEGDESYLRLEEFVSRAAEPVECNDEDADFLDGVVLESPYHTLRKFALLFAARLPTADEIARVDAGGEAALSEVIDEMMGEEAFGVRIAEGFNDLFLTDGVDFHIAGLGTVNHPDLLWFRGFSPDARAEALSRTSFGITQAPNQLVKHIVMTEQPFSQILLADYTMVNPYAARSFSVFDQIEWTDPEDPSEFRPVKLIYRPDGSLTIPHAGMLNTYVYLDRYPSTESNVNRGRARSFMLHFLGLDILKFAPLTADPLEIDAAYENPVRDAPECAVCHVRVDPIAGLFRNYHSAGARYAGPVPEDTFPAGFEIQSADSADVPIGDRTFVDGLLPEARNFDALRWLAEQTVADPRFSLAMTRQFFEIVIGRPLLEQPEGPPSLSRDGAFRAYEVQQAAVEEFRTLFVESNYDAKALTKAIVLSPFFRARAQENSSPEHDAIRFDLGHAQVLTPEQLHRKIVAIYGASFQSFPDFSDSLLALRWYRILYGGHDSTTVTSRLLEPTGVMAGVQHVMANNVSCRQAAREFDLPAEERRLLGGVSMALPSGSEPEIRATLVHIHERLLGERLAFDDPEIDASYGLWVRVQERGAEAVSAGESRTELGRACDAGSVTRDPDYVVRAWAAVLNYLMHSFEFLYP
ncbi:MAG: hypothetical protein AAGF12_02480 [Myxococcota bacterium]